MKKSPNVYNNPAYDHLRSMVMRDYRVARKYLLGMEPRNKETQKVMAFWRDNTVCFRPLVIEKDNI